METIVFLVDLLLNNTLILYYIYRCEVLPENSCQGVPLNYGYYAIDIANRPALINFANTLRTFYEQVHNISSICESFIGMSACLASFPPCNKEINKLLIICECGCSRYHDQILSCVSDLVRERVDLSIYGRIHSSFNCSDPQTYLPNVSASLYDTEQSCYDLYGRR